MAVDGFEELFNTVYIAKKLHDIGRYDLVTENFSDTLDYDMYYANMYSLIQNLFEHHSCRRYDERGFEIHILSDPVIVDFYVLAGKYGKRSGIPDEENPYIVAAEQEAHENLFFSYCLNWKLMGHTEPKRPYHSRLGLIIYYDDEVNPGVLAYNLIELHEWFGEKCGELRAIEDKHKPLTGQLMLDGFVYINNDIVEGMVAA